MSRQSENYDQSRPFEEIELKLDSDSHLKRPDRTIPDSRIDSPEHLL